MGWAWPLLAAPFVGSVLGVLVRRLPRGEPVGWARSRCEACGATLGARDLVPLLSYVLLRGRCRRCAAPISPMHPAIELAAVAVAASAALVAPDPATLWADCALGWGLLALAWIDAEHLRLPDALTLPLLLLGLAATALLDPAALADHALAAALGYAAFRAVSLGYRRWRGREGLGAGDAKLLAAGGAWVGLEALSSVVLLGAVLGLCGAALLVRPGREGWRTTRVPFGPSLALAIWAVQLGAGLATGQG